MTSRHARHRAPVRGLLRRRVVFLAVGCLLVTAACKGDDKGSSANPPSSAVEAGTSRPTSVVYTSTQQLRGFNQLSATSASQLASNVMAQVWPSAYSVDGSGTLQMNTDLLTGVEQPGPAERTIVYHLNPQAIWSDGDPLDANDFVYLWSTAYTSGAADSDGSPIQATTTSLQGIIESVTPSADARTVTVTLVKPFADWRLLFGHLLPSHIAKRVGFNHGFDVYDASIVVSGGPFRIDSVVPENEIRLVRNERYWSKGASLESIVVKERVSVDDALAGFIRDEIDLTEMFGSPTTTVDKFQVLPGISTTVVPLERSERLYFNFRNAHLQQSQVRRAIALAIDRSELSSAHGAGGQAQILNSRFYVPTEAGYRDTSDGSFNGAHAGEAKKLLESVGFVLRTDGVYERDGKRLSFKLPTGGSTAQQIAQQLAGVGIHIELGGGDPLEVLRSGDFDLMITSRPVLGSAKSAVASEFLTSSPVNYGSYSEPAVDDLLRAANSEQDAARRRELYGHADELLWRDLPTLPLGQVRGALVRRQSLENVAIRPSGGAFETAQDWSKP